MKLIKELTDKEVLGKEKKFDGKYSLRKAARAIVFDGEKIGLLHATKMDFHKLPGGGIDEGEDIKLALDRELLEELGLEVEITGELGEIVEYRNDTGFKQNSYCYLVKVVGDKKEQNLTKMEKEIMGVEIIWVTLDEAIDIFEKENPENYHGKFIRVRDLEFLKKAREIVTG